MADDKFVWADDKCVWTEDAEGYWTTGCDEVFSLADGSPEDSGFKYCPYCGKVIEQKTVQDQEEPDDGEEG